MKQIVFLGDARSLTSAGVGVGLWSAGVSEEALLTALAVTALRVALAVVTHAAAPPPRRQPQRAAEVTALGTPVTLALCVQTHTRTMKED